MSVTLVAASLTDADVGAMAASAQGTEAVRWLAMRPGRTGLVVWADATTSEVGAHWVGVSLRRHVVMTYGRRRPGPRSQGDSRCASVS